jgi:hypothetical protein
MHEPMFDGHVQQLGGRSATLGAFQGGCESLVKRVAHGLPVTKYLGVRRPILGLVAGKAAIDRIDAESKKLVQLRRERAQTSQGRRKEIQIKGLKMA